jgi:predicted helicase
MSDNYQIYFKEVQHQYKTKDTTEHSFRTQLENFLKDLDQKCSPLHESKHDKIFGAPDYKIFFNGVKVGYIETKDLGVNLDEILKTDQIKKYSDSISNLILTNYCRFILLRNGENVLDITLFTLSDLNNNKFKISSERIAESAKLFDTFLTYRSLSITTSEALARELSKKAILVKDIAKEQLEEDRIRQKNNDTYTSILDFYQGLEELIHDISDDDCADAYAQTITYGLFLAKIQCQGQIKREFVDQCLPKNIPIIRRIFRDISGSSLPSNLTWIFDEILEVLNASDIQTILDEMDKRGKKDRDPFSHFYEDFLRLYDPAKRERRGVYYTPRPVVNYIVKSVEWVIRNNFGKQLGFADNDVTILDPATGTGTFLWLVYLRTLGELKEKGFGGLIESKTKNQILKNFFGLEILITPYIIAHLKLAMVLKKWHYELGEGERVQVYLTNSLDQGEDHGLIPFMKEINEERRVAHELVMKKPILAIIGNPPYSGHSANKGKWIDDLLKSGYTRADGSKDEGYYRVDGAPLGEKNPKYLQDDYVKFIRFAQWKIDKSGKGVVGFITNHSYLDNPTFRGMRQSLLASFERIYILNLHGSTKKKEKTPDGGKDENVFDIQQGTAILILVKNPEIKDRRIYYADLFGERDEKYQWLDRNSLFTTEWKSLNPKSPFHLLIPFENEYEVEYQSFWKITDIFKENTNGFKTHRDHFAVDFDKSQMFNRLVELVSEKITNEEIKQKYYLVDNRDWCLNDARALLRKNPNWLNDLIQCSYRPFDNRWCYFNTIAMDYPRRLLLDNVAGKTNLCLITPRQIGTSSYRHTFITEFVANDCLLSNISKEADYAFPLYLYSNGERQLNLNPLFIEKIHDQYNETITPESILAYIYAVLHSQKYRALFLNLLKLDFPRIPIVKEYQVFSSLSELGTQLIELHLMKKQFPPTIKYEISGSNTVDSVKYNDGKLYINKTQYFDNIPENVWNFHIGGYQVLDKWLKSRKKRELSVQEILHFIQIVEVLKETIRIMNEIDKIDFLPK